MDLFPWETGIAAPVGQDTNGCLTTGWPQDTSDLAPDPSLVFGRLPNGLRYVLKANAKPEQRVAMYLDVQSGSLNETEDQRGVAHFLEHMLFNGTTHYPPGTLVEYFQSLGMEFGGDVNAHTGFDETVYTLHLPSNTDKMVEEGCKVLADYARGALLLEKEVDRERGVILAEKRSRDSAAARVSKQQMQFDFAGTLVAERDPIGTEAVIKATDSHLLRRYYDRWYRPENMIVVVVGDIQPQTVEPLLARTFSPLTAAETMGDCPDQGQVRESGTDVLLVPDQELGHTELALTTVFNNPFRPHTLGEEITQLRQYLAVRLLSNRLERLEQQPGSPLARTDAQAGIFLQRYGFATLTTQAVAGKWRDGMYLLQTTLAQALQNGFTEIELVRGKRELHAMLEKAAQTDATRTSREWAEEIIRTLNDRKVVLSPAQELALYGPELEKMTLEEVHQALRLLWGHPRRLVEVVGVLPPDLANDQGEATVREAVAAHALAPLPPWVEQQSVSFPTLQPTPDQPPVAETIRHPEIGVTSCALAGGVRLTLKPTDFQANQVLLSVQFGQGKQAEPQQGMARLAQAVINESGIGTLTKEQLQETLAGTNIELEFKVGPESFAFAGSSLTQEFELMLQLLYHRLHDPAFRADAFDRSRENLRRMYDQVRSTVEGVRQIRGDRFLAGACPEFGMASWDEVAQIRLEQIRSWLVPAFAQEPLEINVVGDIDPQKAMTLVHRFFGHEQRHPAKAVAGAPPVFPSGQELRLPVPSSVDKALLTVAWQTGDFWDIGRTRRLHVLAAILEDRLRIRIREELGATYSPRVDNRPSRGCVGFGLLESSLIVTPEQAASLAQVIRNVAGDLGEKGVSEEELHRAREPILTLIRDTQRTNRYWMEAVLHLSSRHPQQLQWPLSVVEDFAAVKADELTALARHFLKPTQAATVIVSPEEKPLHPPSPE